MKFSIILAIIVSLLTMSLSGIAGLDTHDRGIDDAAYYEPDRGIGEAAYYEPDCGIGEAAVYIPDCGIGEAAFFDPYN